MPRSPENPGKSRDSSQERQETASFSFRKEFGLVKVGPQRDWGLRNLVCISEFDGWAIEEESFLGRWLEFSPIKRLRGVHQLGLNRYFPLPNNHTRFDHSAEVALRTVLALSCLARDFRKEFLALSQGYSLNLNPQLSGKKRENEQISKTIKLGAIYAANHDIATPAGGDAIKYIVDLDDDRDLPMVLSWHEKDFAALCQEDGFNPEEVTKLFIKLAQRKEEGILGQLIHCSGQEDRGFDLDSICYTLMDAQVCLGFFRMRQDSRLVIQTELGKAASYLDKQQEELNQRARRWVEAYKEELNRHHQHGVPYPYIDLPFLRPQKPPQFLNLNLEDFSCFDSLALKDGRVVFADSLKLNNLFLLADFLARYVYFSPASLGPEIGLAVDIEFDREKTPFSKKEKYYLLTVDDHSFLENLKKNSPNWAYWFSDLASLGWEESGNLARGTHHTLAFHDFPKKSVEANLYLKKLFSIKQLPSRLATPLSVSGGTKGLGEIFPQSRERIEEARGKTGLLTDTLPFWARPPFFWMFADEYLRPERYRLERRS